MLYATDVLHFGSSRDDPAAVDTTALALPDALGSVILRTEALKGHADGGNAEKVAQQQEQATTEDAATAAALSLAYGGPAAAARSYADPDLLTFVNATAVRAESPRLFLPRVTDPADAGLAVNRENISTDGSVDCYTVRTQVTTAGGTPDPAQIAVSLCQRTGDGLTVRIYPSGGADPEDPDRVATAVAMTNELWDAVSGSAG